ncbi:L-Ala-D/L-Glu epimerase [Klebsiella pneumoniae subsp. pneumoniae]|uniref:L-Ala-D/L-Glu epimerase n=1 Tax=Klebsiella pneumoniae subsp. pneumoniae TaxID=72407 RepID=A0A377ZW96_KLEPN|nr:L-Ala-D/L-Glu epimerase [Klebsiella pneumoniae subsp. pneumoniae]
MRNVRVYEEAWPLHTLFVIARGSRSEAKVVVVELEEDGVKGVGECTPYPRYGESIASVMAQVMAIGEQLEAGLPANSCSGCCRQAPPAMPLTARYGICRPGAKAKPWPSCWAWRCLTG